MRPLMDYIAHHRSHHYIILRSRHGTQKKAPMSLYPQYTAQCISVAANRITTYQTLYVRPAQRNKLRQHRRQKLAYDHRNVAAIGDQGPKRVGFRCPSNSFWFPLPYHITRYNRHKKRTPRDYRKRNLRRTDHDGATTKTRRAHCDGH